MTWQPIETAPRDKSEFLAYDPISKTFDVCTMQDWSNVKGPWWVCYPVQSDGECGPFEDEFQGMRATHWMPLPPAPAMA